MATTCGAPGLSEGSGLPRAWAPLARLIRAFMPVSLTTRSWSRTGLTSTPKEFPVRPGEKGGPIGKAPPPFSSMT